MGTQKNFRLDYVCLIVSFGILGLLIALWDEICSNISEHFVSTTSLLISFIAFFLSLYLTVEKALESRTLNKNKLLCNYSSRFSSDSSIQKVVKWLLARTDKNSDILISDSEEPTIFDKERFMRFYMELNVMLENEQLVEEDTKALFLSYALMFAKLEDTEDSAFDYKQECSSFRDFIALSHGHSTKEMHVNKRNSNSSHGKWYVLGAIVLVAAPFIIAFCCKKLCDNLTFHEGTISFFNWTNYSLTLLAYLFAIGLLFKNKISN